MSNTIHVELDVDLDRHLAGQTTYDHDGDIGTGPTTLEDVILAEVVRTVVQRVVSDRDLYRTLALRIGGIRDETIRAQVEPLVQAALVQSIQPTNHLGEATGEPVTLAERITADATAYLTKTSSRDYNTPGKTPIQKWVDDAVNHTVTAELKNALEDGKAEVKAALRTQGAQLLTETIERMAASAR